LGWRCAWVLSPTNLSVVCDRRRAKPTHTPSSLLPPSSLPRHGCLAKTTLSMHPPAPLTFPLKEVRSHLHIGVVASANRAHGSGLIACVALGAVLKVRVGAARAVDADVACSSSSSSRRRRMVRHSRRSSGEQCAQLRWGWVPVLRRSRLLTADKPASRPASRTAAVMSA
jgi:hypothetical protein